MSAGRGGESSHAVPAAVVRAVAANSDTPLADPSGMRDISPAARRRPLSWRTVVVGGWILLICSFAIGQPTDQGARHWWVDSAWTLTYLVTTLLSVWAARLLK